VDRITISKVFGGSYVYLRGGRVVVVVVGVVLGMSASSVLWGTSSCRILLVVADGIKMGVNLLDVMSGWCGPHVGPELLLVVETVVV
jgi:hypothetical protein